LKRLDKDWPDTMIIGYGDAIKIPKLSQKTTGGVNLGLILSRWNVFLGK
jgi:hypothetical protein